MKFRSKPATCEAEQFRGFYATPYPPGVEFQDNSNDAAEEQKHGRYAFYVVTAHGQRCYIEPQDWIVAEPDGRGYYPVKPDIFEKRWEPMTAAPPE